jgi:AcrR family transcriptional regulator
MAESAVKPGKSQATQKYQRQQRTNDPDQTRADILEAAEGEFARHGYAGTTIDSIAQKTRRSKRMIYYYFNSKAKLYVAVLENAYARIRVAEAKVDLGEEDPRQSLKNLVDFCFDFHFDHPTFVKLIMSENLNDAKYLPASSLIGELHRPMLQRIDQCLRLGYQKELFHQAVTPIEIHMTLSGLCFFNVSNRATFSAIFDVDMTSAAARRARKQQILLTILGRLNTTMEGFVSDFFS